MRRKITATISFILHEDLEKELSEVKINHSDAIKEYLKDCIEHEHAGAAEYNTVLTETLTMEEIKEPDLNNI